MSKYVESTVRTNRLHCSDCGKKIKKGDDAVFLLYGNKMKEVYGECCSKNYMQQVIEDEVHPFSSEGHGQW